MDDTTRMYVVVVGSVNERKIVWLYDLSLDKNSTRSVCLPVKINKKSPKTARERLSKECRRVEIGRSY